VRRPRPDPEAAAARLAALAPARGGWVPPPLDREAVEAAPDSSSAHEPPERSWTEPSPADDLRADALDEVAGGALSALLPVGLRGGRWDPGRRGLAALAAVALTGAVIAGFVVLRARPHEVVAGVVEPVASAAAGPVVVVDVAGKVRRPGIVRLPFGARVDDAVRAAGGPLPGSTFDGLNRARKLADGEQVLVGVPAAAGASVGATDARVDLNLADASALDGLPGIGPVLAQKIVDWRTEHGRFASIDQLREVGGIGESKYAAVKNKVRV
jgi:competence protein ComEA